MIKKNILAVFLFMLMVSFTTGCDDTTTANTKTIDTIQSQTTKSDPVFALTQNSHYFVVDKTASSYTLDVRYQGAMDYAAFPFYSTSVFSAFYGGWNSVTGEGFRALKVIKENTSNSSIVHDVEFVYEGKKIVSKVFQLGYSDTFHLSSPIAKASELDDIANNTRYPQYTWTKGKSQQIRWARGGNWGQQGRTANVSIWLCNYDGTIVSVAPATANDGLLYWTVPTSVPNVSYMYEMLWTIQIGDPTYSFNAGDVIYPENSPLYDKWDQRNYDSLTKYTQSVPFIVENN